MIKSWMVIGGCDVVSRDVEQCIKTKGCEVVSTPAPFPMVNLWSVDSYDVDNHIYLRSMVCI